MPFVTQRSALSNGWRMKVVHIITSLKMGGAEMMLLRLLQQLNGTDYDPYVIGLSEAGDISDPILELGVPVDALGTRKGMPDPSVLWSIARTLRRVKPDAVQTWMYHADLVGAVAARFGGNPPVAWGLHHSDLSPQFIKRPTLMTAKA